MATAVPLNPPPTIAIRMMFSSNASKNRRMGHYLHAESRGVGLSSKWTPKKIWDGRTSAESFRRCYVSA